MSTKYNIKFQWVLSIVKFNARNVKITFTSVPFTRYVVCVYTCACVYHLYVCIYIYIYIPNIICISVYIYIYIYILLCVMLETGEAGLAIRRNGP